VRHLVDAISEASLGSLRKQRVNKKTGRVATGVDPYSKVTLNTTPAGLDPGPTRAEWKKTRYAGIDFTIPGAVKKAAEQGLKERQFNIENGMASRPGGTGIGVARARWLKSEKDGNPREIRRIAAYFGRHGYAQKRDEKGRLSPGMVADLLWGGAPGRKWSESIVKKMDAADARADKNESIAAGLIGLLREGTVAANVPTLAAPLAVVKNPMFTVKRSRNRLRWRKG
jgi:hypothetical protein